MKTRILLAGLAFFAFTTIGVAQTTSKKAECPAKTECCKAKAGEKKTCCETAKAGNKAPATTAKATTGKAQKAKK